MHRSVGMGPSLLLAVVGAVLLQGCAATSGSPTAPPSNEPAAPKVQRLVFAGAPLLVESNRATVAYLTHYWQLAPMYEFLLGVTPEGKEAVPQLATAWSLEPDGYSYRFKLKQGVPFHNGKGELGAKDVQHSWKALRDEADPPATGQALTVSRQILDVEIINDAELVLRLAKPDAGFLNAVSQAENVLPISSKMDADSRARPPAMQDPPYAGTGPYQYSERQEGRYLRYRRPPDKHWRQTPDFPEFEFRLIKESSTMLAALLAREVQLAALPPELASQGEQAGFKSIPGKAPGLHTFMPFQGLWINKRFGPTEILNADPDAPYVFMNTPLRDVRVRKALNKAIDRDALNKAFLRGRGDTIYNEYFHPTRPGWNPAWQQNFKEAYGYDPEAAKKLLAEAGYGPNKPMIHTVQLRPAPYFPAVGDMDEAVANYWRAIGVDVKLEQADSATFNAKARVLTYDNHSYIHVTSFRPLVGAGVFSSSTTNSRAGAQFPELDKLLEQIKITLEPKQYDELWRKWGDMAYEGYIHVPLFWMPAEAVADPNIVADYLFPGSITGTYTHVEYIKAAR